MILRSVTPVNGREITMAQNDMDPPTPEGRRRGLSKVWIVGRSGTVVDGGGMGEGFRF